MRRIRIISLLLLLACGLYAQPRLARPENYVGFNAGANMTMMRFSPKLKTKMNIGAVGGITWRYVTDKHCGIQMELNYVQRGWKEDDADYTRCLDYLEIPLLTHIYFGKKVRFTFTLGPKISYLVSDRHRGKDDPLCDVDQYGLNSKFDYGICGGPGLEVHGKRHVFFLDSRFCYGLGNAFSIKKSSTPQYDASSAYTVSVTLGYLIRTNRD